MLLRTRNTNPHKSNRPAKLRRFLQVVVSGMRRRSPAPKPSELMRRRIPDTTLMTCQEFIGNCASFAGADTMERQMADAATSNEGSRRRASVWPCHQIEGGPPTDLCPFPAEAEDLLAKTKAPPRLRAHLDLVHDVACQLTAQIREAWPGLAFR